MFRFIVIKKKFSIFLIISYGVQDMGTRYGYKLWVQGMGTRYGYKVKGLHVYSSSSLLYV